MVFPAFLFGLREIKSRISIVGQSGYLAGKQKNHGPSSRHVDAGQFGTTCCQGLLGLHSASAAVFSVPRACGWNVCRSGFMPAWFFWKAACGLFQLRVTGSKASADDKSGDRSYSGPGARDTGSRLPPTNLNRKNCYLTKGRNQHPFDKSTG